MRSVPQFIAIHSAAPSTGRAAHSVQLAAGEAPEWLHLVPAGTFRGVDGRGPFTVADAREVIQASMAGGRPLPVDYDHATDLAAPRGEAAPAAAWIEELQARDDGIWGRVAYTPRGAEAVKNREYRFLSPVFLHGKTDGVVTRILRASLTNNPNLQLTALNSAQVQPGDKMDELLQQLRELLGLPATATVEQILAAIKGAREQSGAAKDMGELATAAGLPATAKTGEIVAAIQAARAAKADPAKFVPVEQVTALQARLTSLETERATEKATVAVDQAIADGRLLPALRQWGLELHAKDPAAFSAYVAKAPKIVDGTTVVTGDPPTGGAGVTSAEADIIARMGVDPEAFKATKKQEGYV